MITDGTGWPLRTGRPGAGRPPGDTTQPHDRRRVAAVGTGVSRRRSPTVPGGPLRTGRPGAGRGLAGHGDTTQPVIVAELRRSGPGFPGDDHRRPPVAGRGLAGRGLAVGWPWAGRG